VSVGGGRITRVEDEPETVRSWTNQYTAEYKRRQEMLMAMRPHKVIAMRDSPLREPKN
jgi:hypothetical protein